MAVYNKVVADDFDVPLVVQGDRFTLRPLSPEYADLDYAAVTASKPILGDIFSDCWPEDIRSREDNLAYISEDYQDFIDRTGFSYIILDNDERFCIGCVYLFPSLYEGSDVAVYYWFNIEVVETPLAEKVESFIRQWVGDFWRIEKPAYPGRDIPWGEWLSRSRKIFPEN
ncbi:GNAT family N-acetyltransferase [Erwinia pyrifoliae]|uniref:GNAT family N-acetyltransferase n=1 Tax=Erwinia pyrifoliae TaxID=79967 RepID=A0ABY5X9G4_ERWPY|nr:GNAT family N-acetyltransferase [Erwinia pyrifoliae]AUX74257.1 N-acetyltransferase [Erwinia pyrifoliae]MCA8875390.1 GNAT family N-acetyltransferase [Erwinia pyrifoliae]MCT2385315.1 GNAT family N-acetyltransferase [Erwinia pyrifoliae]MCU8585460.1 GNAT family N-acetyltransferase [Erwinia pyrifoliae]UWS29449.1 GNAT family N-acetyltransferase [Erwinia pyrifoliae]